MNKQFGGTLGGLIGGLLIGLAAALAVAVYVTKVPTPLVDRGVQRKPDQDALEQQRNRDWNPNAGLASKNVPVLTKPAEEAVETAPAHGAEIGIRDAGKTAGQPAVAKDPLGTLIQSRADSAAAKPAPAASEKAATDGVPEIDPFLYFVQVGAYRAPEEAETQRAKVAMLGFDAKVSEREQAGRLVYRLRLGPYRQKVDADRAQERLAAQGVEAALVRTQR